MMRRNSNILFNRTISALQITLTSSFCATSFYLLTNALEETPEAKLKMNKAELGCTIANSALLLSLIFLKTKEETIRRVIEDRWLTAGQEDSATQSQKMLSNLLGCTGVLGLLTLGCTILESQQHSISNILNIDPDKTAVEFSNDDMAVATKFLFGSSVITAITSAFITLILGASYLDPRHQISSRLENPFPRNQRPEEHPNITTTEQPITEPDIERSL